MIHSLALSRSEVEDELTLILMADVGGGAVPDNKKMQQCNKKIQRIMSLIDKYTNG